MKRLASRAPLPPADSLVPRILMKNLRAATRWTSLATVLTLSASACSDNASQKETPTQSAGAGGDAAAASGAPGSAGMATGGSAGTAPQNDGPTAGAAMGGNESGDNSQGGAGGSGGSGDESLAGAGGAPDGATGGAGGDNTGGTAGGGMEPSSAGAGGALPEQSCVMMEAWPELDASSAGPYQVVTETNVGPTAGVAENGMVPRFNLYRPSSPGEGGVCHPIVTWGNGHGDNPRTYEVLIKQLVSHGFVVVASLSSNTSQGDPLPTVAGIDWMLEENENPDSPLYHALDTNHIGATGHSEGAGATVTSGSDPRITTIAPIHGGSTANKNLHGPALYLCGGQDTVARCSNIENAVDGIDNQPVMLAENLKADHGSWLNQGGIQGPTIIAATAWMRLHLMGDESQRDMFYGATCELCEDTANWRVKRKMMGE